MVDTNQKASELGVSLLQEQRAETKKRRDEAKEWETKNKIFDLGVGIYENTVLDRKAEEFALSNSPFKAKLIALQGNASNILSTQKKIDSTGEGGYGGNAYNYWLDHYSRQLTKQWANQTGKTPPRASVASRARELTNERLKEWDKLVSSARAVPSTVEELEKDWGNYQKLNIPTSIGEQMGKGIRNLFRSDEERKNAESLTKSDINSNPLFAKYKNFADRYEVYSKFNPGMADAIHELATKEEWNEVLDPNFTPVTSTQTISVLRGDGTIGEQLINTVRARTIDGNWVYSEVRGATSVAEAATGAELDSLYDDLNPDGELALNKGMRENPNLTIQQLYALYYRPPYTKVDLTDEKVALENETTARKLYEMEMFELDPNKYYKQNFTVSGLEYKRTDIPLPEGVPDFKTWFASKKLEWNNYKPRGVSWQKGTQGSSTGTSTVNTETIENQGTLIVRSDLSEDTRELLNSDVILNQISDKEGIIPITFGPNKTVPRSSITDDTDDDTLVQLVYNTDDEEFYMLPTNKKVSDLHRTEIKEGWLEDTDLTTGESVELADGSTLTWTGSQFEQSGSGLTAKRITFADIPDGKIKEGITSYVTNLYTALLDPEYEIRVLEKRLETGIHPGDLTKPWHNKWTGQEYYVGQPPFQSQSGREKRKSDEERLAYLKANPKKFEYQSIEELLDRYTDIIDLATLGDKSRVKQMLLDAFNSKLPNETSILAYLEDQGISTKV